MSDLTAKAAYLRGLADGMKLDDGKDCNKLILSIIEFLSESAERIDELDSEVGFLSDSIDEMDDELDEIAEIFAEIGGDCGGCGEHCDDNKFEVACPTCKKNIALNMEDFDDEALCPFCGEEIEFDFDFGDEIGEE